MPLKKVRPRDVSGKPRHSRDGFYIGVISVGLPPQRMRVMFDTASGHVLLAHRACKSRACVEHHRYSPWESSTAVDVNPGGDAVQAGVRLAKGPVNRSVVTVEFTQADLGQGQAQGVLVRDDVCLLPDSVSSQACASMAVLAATKEDDEPFRAMPHDGIVGLALEGLAAGQLSSFYERLMDSTHRLLPQFGLSLGPDGGKIIFGGHAEADLAGPIEWFPVLRPEEGFWQVRIEAIRVGNTTVDSCQSGCHGIIDTGSSSLGVPKRRLSKLLSSLSSTRSASGECEGPVLQLDLGGSFLELKAEDYSGRSCEPEFGALDMDEPQFSGVYALGTTVLHRYYTAFDWAGGNVGFAGLAHHGVAAQRPAPALATGVVV